MVFFLIQGILEKLLQTDAEYVGQKGCFSIYR